MSTEEHQIFTIEERFKPSKKNSKVIESLSWLPPTEVHKRVKKHAERMGCPVFELRELVSEARNARRQGYVKIAAKVGVIL